MSILHLALKALKGLGTRWQVLFKQPEASNFVGFEQTFPQIDHPILSKRSVIYNYNICVNKPMDALSVTVTLTNNEMAANGTGFTGYVAVIYV
jgi:hypothetical protein